MRYIDLKRYISIMFLCIIVLAQLMYSITSNLHSTRKALVTISFDDWHRSVYTIIYPIMKERGLVATFFVGTVSINLPSRIRSDELVEMEENGWEIGSHGWAEKLFTQQTEKQLINLLNQSIIDLANYGLNTEKVTLAYPGGAWNNTVIEYVNNFFYGARATAGQPLSEFTTPIMVQEQRYHIEARRIRLGNVTVGKQTVQHYKNLVDSAIQNGSWLNLYGHVANETMRFGVEMYDYEFAEICDYIKTKVDAGLVEVVTFKDGLTRFLD